MLVVMNVSIQDLPPIVIDSYEAREQSFGVPLEVFLHEYLIKNAPSTPPVSLSADEWEKALDDCFDSFPSTGPLPDDAFDRDNIYGLEHKWQSMDCNVDTNIILRSADQLHPSAVQARSAMKIPFS